MITKCRACTSDSLTSIVDLGEQYLSDFRIDYSKPERYPLNLLLCNNCNLAQLDTTVNRTLMYHDGYGYQSGINETIVQNLKMLVNCALRYVPKPNSWLDIACNDGTLLSLVPNNAYRVGVDPVKKFKKKSNEHADLIISDFYPCEETNSLNAFDVITSISMFYDLDDPNLFVKEVKAKLAKNGIWVVQQNYLMSMLENNSFDNICHEHIEYYSLQAMKLLIESHYLEIIDVFLDDINGGSLITIIAHKGQWKISENVQTLLDRELDFGLNTLAPYKAFNSRINLVKEKLLELLVEIKSQNQRVQIYGASTRGATIWQYLGIGIDLVEAAVERQPGKVGKVFSAIGIPIISEEQMRENPPDFLLVGPWFLKESFLERETGYLEQGGKFIFPLPEVEIVTHRN